MSNLFLKNTLIKFSVIYVSLAIEPVPIYLAGGCMALWPSMFQLLVRIDYCLNLSLLYSNCFLSFIFQIICVNVSMSSLLFIFSKIIKIVDCCHLFFKSYLLNVHIIKWFMVRKDSIRQHSILYHKLQLIGLYPYLKLS